MGPNEHFELSEEFYEHMNARSEKQHADWRLRGRNLSFIAHLSRLFWCFLAQFSQIDIYGGLQNHDASKNKWSWKHRENFDKRYASVNRVRWWPYMAFTLYGYSSIRLVIITLYQYAYDINLMRLQVLKALTTRDNTVEVSIQLSTSKDSAFIRYIRSHLQEVARRQPSEVIRMVMDYNGSLSGELLNERPEFEQLAELSRDLHERVRWARASLKLLGSPYIKMHFVVEIIYAFMLFSSFMLIVVITIYYNHIRPFDYGLTRAFLDLKHERRLQNRSIVNEINKFIVSSRNFTHICIEQLKLYSKKHLTARRASSDSAATVHDIQQHVRVESNKLLLDHILTRTQLKQMALNGILLPAHRTPQWVEQTSILMVLIQLTGMLYALIGTLWFAFVFFAFSQSKYLDIEISAMDLLVIVEAGIQLTFIIPICIFFISQIIANCVDQIYYGLDLGRQIHDCMASNGHLFRAILELQQISPDSNFGAGLLGAALGIDLKDSSATRQSQLQDCSSQLQYLQYHLGERVLNLDRQHQQQVEPMETDNLAAGPLRDRRATIAAGRQQPRQPQNRLPELDAQIGQLVPESGCFRANRTSSWSVNTQRRPTLSRSMLIESYQTQMNSKLLMVFMHYKIFVAQIKPLTRSFGTFVSACVLMLIICPINLRMHSPYLNQANKYHSLSFILLCVTIIDLCLIPLCYMYSRCLELYKCQSSLLAHVIEVSTYRNEPADNQRRSRHATRKFTTTSVQATNSRPQIYDSHTVWLLRKELNHPHQLANQFAIYAFNICLSYSSLLRIHFWVGIISLSMVVDASSNQEFFGRLFNDPFGVFNWHPGKELALTGAGAPGDH